MDWSKLSSTTRLRGSQLSFLRDEDEDRRSPFERDYERVVFSSAFRRLQDKTQAFPIEPSDYVRTRLTHSVEVAALGRSLASTAMRNLLDKHLERSVNPEDAAFIVATACLLHDLGNPPFGHSGEAAIQEWFAEHRSAFEFGDA
ncbi:MAG: dNTP triphosphohydrolase, partial [Thermoanaerobaculia bacterium]|nr:dNTP triphosphohydrolase [Thermoanaerobaculia bacterium]